MINDVVVNMAWAHILCFPKALLIFGVLVENMGA